MKVLFSISSIFGQSVFKLPWTTYVVSAGSSLAYSSFQKGPDMGLGLGSLIGQVSADSVVCTFLQGIAHAASPYFHSAAPFAFNLVLDTR